VYRRAKVLYTQDMPTCILLSVTFHL